MPTGTIRQTVALPGTPEEVYEALMTSRGHAAFTSASARISPRVGGSIMAWDGYIHGTNVELVPNRRIVQRWQPAEEEWPEGHESTVTFVLAAARGGTRLTFLHTDVPRDQVHHLRAGWKESYWQPLRAYLRAQHSAGRPKRPRRK